MRDFVGLDSNLITLSEKENKSISSRSRLIVKCICGLCSWRTKNMNIVCEIHVFGHETVPNRLIRLCNFRQQSSVMISLNQLPCPYRSPMAPRRAKSVFSWMVSVKFDQIGSSCVCVWLVELITGTSGLLEIAMDDFLLMQEAEAFQNLSAPGL